MLLLKGFVLLVFLSMLCSLMAAFVSFVRLMQFNEDEREYGAMSDTQYDDEETNHGY